MTETDLLYREYKMVALPQDTHLTSNLVEKISRLLDQAPAHELRDHLQEIYHTYIIREHNALPVNFEKIAMNIHMLIECFTLAANEKTQEQDHN